MTPGFQQDLLDRHLTDLLGEMEPAARELLHRHLQWVVVGGGQTLLTQGDPGDAMYLVISGRLRAYQRQDDGSERVLREMGRGQVIGELSLFTDEPRSATIVAIRDSVLVRLDKPAFAQRQGAQLARHARAAIVDAASVDRALQQPGLARREPGALAADHAIGLHLDAVEAAHEIVLLVGDGDVTGWTRRCTRRADELLLLAGGGARGFAHLGVYRALREHGIEIDCVGGTSMGSVMTVLVASDRPLDEVMAVVRQAFRINPTGDFNLLPLISLIAGRRLRRVIRDATRTLLGFEADAEDLWKPFYCVANNYTQAREQVVQRGSLVQALLASIAIPGALPPVLHQGDLLCDGGTFNNFPVDVMRGMHGVWRVIGVDLSIRRPRALAFEEVPGTWALLRERLRPRRRRRYQLPSLMSYPMNVTILYSSSRQRQAQRLTDVYFNPPLDRVGMLQWKRLDDIVEQGLAHARQVLQALPPEKRPAAQPLAAD